MKLRDLFESEMSFSNFNSNDVTGMDEKGLMEMAEFVVKNTSKWLSEVPLDKTFYRGYDNINKTIFFREIRDDRKPVDTHKTVHEYYVRYLKKRGAVAHRGNSAFITREESEASEYGKPFVVLPTNDFHYTWVSGLKDFTERFNNVLRKVAAEVNEERSIDAEISVWTLGMDSLNLENELHKEYLQRAFEYMDEYTMDGNVHVDKGIDQVTDEEVMVRASGLFYIDLDFFHEYFNHKLVEVLEKQ